MAEQTLWTSYTPAVTNENDSQQYALGTTFYAVASGWVLGVKWRFPDTLPTGSVTAKLWRNDGDDTVLASGTELASATFSAPVAGTVNEVRFAAPVAIVANQDYVVSIKTADRYVATSGYDPFDLGGSGLSVGDLRAPANGSDPIGVGTLHNGKLNDLTGHQYPHQTFSNANYWVDVIFTTDDPSGATPSSSDTGTGTDAATVAAAATGSDAGTGTQNQTLTTSLASSQSGTGTEAQTLAGSSSSTDTGAGTQDQALAALVASAESGVVAELQALIAAQSGSESGVATEGWSLVVAHTSSELGLGADDEDVPSLMSSDSATGTETQSLAVLLTGADSANLIESTLREIEGVQDTQQYPITIIHRQPGITIQRTTGLTIARTPPGVTIRS